MKPVTAKFGALVLGLGMILSNTTFADDSIDDIKQRVDGLGEQLAGMQSTLDALAKIKISGYIQTQYQFTQQSGQASLSGPAAIGGFSGGSLPTGVRERFQVRRGRLKINYVNGLSQYVLQFDVSQNGVGIKDAYIAITDPWMKSFTLTSGAFDRPFGFEIGYSSSQREAPERSRMYQTLFPNERDLGAKIEYSTDSGPLSFLKGKVGFFNGMGIPGSNAGLNEIDNCKDLIGRVGVVLPMYEQNMELDGGVSFYNGSSKALSKQTYSVTGGDWKVDSTATNKFKYFDRSYFGFDAQYYADFPVIGGLSLRGEYIGGKQPSTSGDNKFYNPAAGTTPALYQRNFSGYYLNYVQNVGKSDQLVLKLDNFDPNTDASAGDIGKAGKHFTNADIAYTTTGIGWVHYLDGNTKMTIYYDGVSNEKINDAATGSLAQFKHNVRDDVLTVRMQYKF